MSHDETVGENEKGDKSVLPPSLVFEPPTEEGQQGQEGGRMPKTSLPARMSDLYQVPEQVLHIITLPPNLLPRATLRTPRRWCRFLISSSRELPRWPAVGGHQGGDH